MGNNVNLSSSQSKFKNSQNSNRRSGNQSSGHYQVRASAHRQQRKSNNVSTPQEQAGKWTAKKPSQGLVERQVERHAEIVHLMPEMPEMNLISGQSIDLK